MAVQKSNTICVLQHIYKSYGRKDGEVLSGVNLALYKGEIVGIRGQNGAGKSTLLEILSGNLKPDQGTISWWEEGSTREIAQKASRRPVISYVPQDIALYQTMTGAQNLKFWGITYGLPRKVIKTRSKWLLKQVGLDRVGRNKVSTYSGGMKRRLHLASALMATPDLLLLDEPTVGADVESAQIILKLLHHFRNLGCCIVLVTHQAGELEQVCDRILTLEQGHLTEAKQ